MLDLLCFFIIPAIVSLTVSIWFGRQVINRTVGIMEKMDAEQQLVYKDIQDAILAEMRNLRNIR